jgi:hypothetical protein
MMDWTAAVILTFFGLRNEMVTQMSSAIATNPSNSQNLPKKVRRDVFWIV